MLEHTKYFPIVRARFTMDCCFSDLIIATWSVAKAKPTHSGHNAENVVVDSEDASLGGLVGSYLGRVNG